MGSIIIPLPNGVLTDEIDGRVLYKQWVERGPEEENHPDSQNGQIIWSYYQKILDFDCDAPDEPEPEVDQPECCLYGADENGLYHEYIERTEFDPQSNAAIDNYFRKYAAGELGPNDGYIRY